MSPGSRRRFQFPSDSTCGGCWVVFPAQRVDSGPCCRVSHCGIITMCKSWDDQELGGPRALTRDPTGLGDITRSAALNVTQHTTTPCSVRSLNTTQPFGPQNPAFCLVPTCPTLCSVLQHHTRPVLVPVPERHILLQRLENTCDCLTFIERCCELFLHHNHVT